MSNETWTIDSWLYSTLHGDTTLHGLVTGIFADVAPANQAYPFLIFALQEAGDVLSINGVRIMTQATYQVRVVTDSESYGAIKSAVERADTLLHRVSGSVAGGVVISCVREAPLRYTEQQGPRLYRHLGGFYHFQVQ